MLRNIKTFALFENRNALLRIEIRSAYDLDMPKCDPPRSEAEWRAWEREKKGLKPLMTPEEKRRSHAASKRKLRARNVNQRTRLATVTPIPKQSEPEPESPKEPTPMGENEVAWLAFCEASPLAQDKPHVVANGRSLNRVLDDPSMIPMWPTTVRALEKLRAELQSPRRKSRGRLVSIQAKSNVHRRAQ